METIEPALAICGVLTLLGTMLWWLRKKGMAGPLLARGPARRKLEVLERLQLTSQHSLCLVRMAERALLIAVSPGGCVLLDNRERLEDDRGGVRG